MNHRVAAALAVLSGAGLCAQETPLAFEVATVKPQGPVRNTGTPVYGHGCDGGFPRIQERRFTVTTTLYALISWAYGYNKTWGCSYVSFGDLISGGPSWVRNERFEIQGLMPEGTPAYTDDAFLAGNAPQLEAMLRTLLAERFQLIVHPVTKQVDAMALVLGRGELKLTRPTGDEQRSPLGIRPLSGPNGEVSIQVRGRKVEGRDIAFILLTVTRQMVLDRTGLTGEFNIDLEFAPFGGTAAAPSAAPSLFTALQEKGLRLENVKAPIEGW